MTIPRTIYSRHKHLKRFFRNVGDGDGRTLDLDFTSGVLDSRILFTRTGNATFINSSGQVQWANSNIAKRSENPAQWGGPNNITPTTPPPGTVISPGGNLTAAQLNMSGSSYCYQTATNGVVGGQQYTGSIYVRAVAGIETVTLRIVNSNDGNNGIAVTQEVGTAWTRVSGSFTPASSGTLIDIGLDQRSGIPNGGSGNAANVYVWGLQLQPGGIAGPYLVTTSSEKFDQPRFDHDPTTLAPRGLLIEGSATNLLLYSGDFTGYNFISTALGATATAPDNGTAYTLRENSASTTFFSMTSGNRTVAASTAHTLSIFIKAAATPRRYINVRVNDGGSNANAASVVWDTQTNTVSGAATAYGTFSAASSASTQYGSWYRVELRFTNGAGITSVNCKFELSNDGSRTADGQANFYAGGTTAGVLLWGAQLETGSGASSYIPTGAIQLTRALDSATISSSSFDFQTTGGTFQVNYFRGQFGSQDRMAFSAPYAPGRWLGTFTASGSNTVYLGWWLGFINTAVGSTFNRAAFTYGQTTGRGATLQLPVKLCVNGGTCVGGTFGNETSNGLDVPNPANMTQFTIGAGSQTGPFTTASRDFLNNCVSRVIYWPFVQSDSTLQSLTT